MKLINPFSKQLTTRLVIVMSLNLGLFMGNAEITHAQSLSDATVVHKKVNVTGVVKDKTGEPIIGASVIEIGTSNGTITDFDGNFSLSIPNGSKIQVSYIGYKSQTIQAVGEKSINVILKEDSETLDEVVVVGYGAVKKSDLTSSISTVKGKELEKTVSGNPLNALQGKVSGVQITNTSGAPGSTPRIIIRGVTSQNGVSPLYVVDGIPGVSLNSISSSDILSMEILKDAAATSIYGSRGANGVVLVTTKKGNLNTPIKFNVSLKQGFQHLAKPEIANAEEYKNVYNARYTNDGAKPAVAFEDNGINTDWWKEIVRTIAPTNDYNISFNGGGAKFAYNGSVGYYRQDSQTKDKGYWDRISARINLDYTVNKYVKFGQSFAPRVENSESYYDGIGSALQYDPTISVLLPEDQREGKDIFNIYSQSTHTTVWNPVAAQDRTFGNTKWFGMLSNTYIQIEPIKGLILRSQFGFNTTHSDSSSFTPEFNLGTPEKQDVNVVTSQLTNAYNWTWNNTATYIKEIKKHNITGMLGYVMEENNSNYLSASKEGVPNSYNEALRYLNSATANPKASGIKSSSSLISYLGRAMYNYDNRYYLTATYRVDGSSKFMGNKRYASFPSLSAAYNIKN